MFNDLKWRIDLLKYDLERFGDNVSLALNNVADTIKDVESGIDNVVNDLKVMSKEFSEDLKDAIIEDAYNINFEVGEIVSKITSVSDKVNERIEDVVETLGNALHLYKGKMVAAEPELAAHLYVSRFFDAYTHHGLYIGDGRVIHFANTDFDSICIHESTLEEFSQGQIIYSLSKSDSPIRYSKETVIHRATTRMNEDEYNLVCNNCENFVRWCRFGPELDYKKCF